MSKFLTTMAVLATTLGATTAIAGGVYIKDNKDVVSDYLKGNKTYTCTEYDALDEKNNNLQSVLVTKDNEISKIKAELNDALNSQTNEHPMNAELKKRNLLRVLIYDCNVSEGSIYLGGCYPVNGSEQHREMIKEELNNHQLYQQCINDSVRYRWIGWALTPDGEPISLDTLELDAGLLELYARYEIIETSIFYLDGSTSGANCAVQIIDGKAEIPDITEHIPEGCRFAGWGTQCGDINSIVDIATLGVSPNTSYFAIFVNEAGEVFNPVVTIGHKVGNCCFNTNVAKDTELNIRETFYNSLGFMLPAGCSVVGRTSTPDSIEADGPTTFIVNESVSFYYIFQTEDGTRVNSSTCPIVNVSCSSIGCSYYSRVCVSEEDFRAYLTAMQNEFSPQLAEQHLGILGIRHDNGELYSNVDAVPFSNEVITLEFETYASSSSFIASIGYTIGDTTSYSPVAKGTELNIQEDSRFRFPDGYSVVGTATTPDSIDANGPSTFIVNESATFYLIFQAEDGTRVNSSNCPIINVSCGSIGWSASNRICVSGEDFRAYLAAVQNELSPLLLEQHLSIQGIQHPNGEIYSTVDEVPFSNQGITLEFVTSEIVEG